MPRFEPAVEQSFVPEDPFIMKTLQSLPPRPSSSRSHGRKKSNSVSALERLVILTDATQKVKRRLRNVIAGAVGASTSGRPKRKSRDAMNVDFVWNGWFDTSVPSPETQQLSEQQLPEPEPVEPVEPVARPRPSSLLPNFAPTINRYSVNMDAESISDVSMHSGNEDDEGAATPRANTPQPNTPVASPKKVTAKSTEEHTSDDEDDGSEAGEHDDQEHEEDAEEEEEVDGHEEAGGKSTPSKSKLEADIVSLRSPMDEDPVGSLYTPKFASPSPLPASKSPIERPSDFSDDDRTPPLQSNSRTSSTESSPRKTPKLTLITNLNPTPVKKASPVLLGPYVSDTFTASPVGLGLDLEAEILMFKGLDLMDVIPPSAISQDGAPTYVLPLSSEREDTSTQEGGAATADAEAAIKKTTLLPPAKLAEKTPRKTTSRRSSRAADTVEAIACSPRRAAILAGKKPSKSSLNTSVEPAPSTISPTTLRAKIDALPQEQDDSIPAWGVWTLPICTPFFHLNDSSTSMVPPQYLRNIHDPQ